MKIVRNLLERRYGEHHLHFITFSCYRRMPLLSLPKNRDVFIEILNDVRNKRGFLLAGYVVMPEHVHLLVSEPDTETPSVVMQVLKQRVARALGAGGEEGSSPFWQRRFYDFNVWTRKKRFEKLHYMHMNPVKRGLVDDPGVWKWSSYRYYQFGEAGNCTPDREPESLANRPR
ncbi:MAG: REP-associated tyrosine transposase [Candidatus Acidiferrales bacterium]